MQTYAIIYRSTVQVPKPNTNNGVVASFIFTINYELYSSVLNGFNYSSSWRILLLP